MPRRRDPLCLWIGDQDHYEWRNVILWLTEHIEFVQAEAPAAILPVPETQPPFELIILAQSRPGQFPTGDVEKLQQRWPDARLLGIVSSWCEGEVRSGRPWPGVWRVAASELIFRLRDLLNVDQTEVSRSRGTRKEPIQEQAIILNTSRPPRRSRSWLLPQNLGDAERLYYEAAEPLPSGTGDVLIATTSQDAFETLAIAVRQAGFSATWQRPRAPIGSDSRIGSGSRAAIWDAHQGTDTEWSSIYGFAKSVSPVPLMVILGFPRPEDFARAAHMSAEIHGHPDHIAVLAKPQRLSDLCSVLVRITGITRMHGALDPRSSNPNDSPVVPSATGYY